MSRLIAFAALLVLGLSWADDAAEKAAPPEPAPTVQPGGDCLTETGSRIKRDAEHPCIAAPGRVLDRDDLDRTGAVNTTDAVRKLVPQAR